jgi:AcrR family transcriptional regulator
MSLTHAAEDPRVVRSKTAVLETTRELLREFGFGGVTVDAVTARSGVAKTTIYRHWPDSNALLLDAFTFEKPIVDFDETDDLRADLRRGVRRLVADLSGDSWGPLFPAMMEASERDHDFRRLSRAFIDERRRPLLVRLTRAAKSRQLSADTDVELLASAIVGPIFYRRFVSRQAMAKVFPDQVVDLALRGVGYDG